MEYKGIELLHKRIWARQDKLQLLSFCAATICSIASIVIITQVSPNLFYFFVLHLLGLGIWVGYGILISLIINSSITKRVLTTSLIYWLVGMLLVVYCGVAIVWWLYVSSLLSVSSTVIVFFLVGIYFIWLSNWCR